MDWGILLGIVGVLGIPLALAAIGLTMVPTTAGEYTFIRACFVAAAATPTVTIFLLLWNTEGSTAMRIVMAAVAGALIFGGVAAAFDWNNKKQYPSVGNKDPAPKKDPAILVECHLGAMPTTPERIYALNLFPTPKENGGGGLVEYFSFDERKGDRIWPKSKPGFPLMAYRCQLTNYDGATLFGVEINMKLKFQEAVKQESGALSGKTFLQRDWPILIGKIDPGAANAFVFYVFSTTEHFATVSFPDAARAKQLIDDDKKQVRLINPAQMSFVPFEPAPPEAAATK
jgi:hypothetical protein